MLTPTRIRMAAALVVAGCGLLLAARAEAQLRERLPLVVFDVQAAVPRLPTKPGFSLPRGLNEADLPSWGPGANVGAQVFLRRGTRVSLGVGSSIVVARGTRSADAEEGVLPSALGPTVRTNYAAIVPNASINFGHRQGWSYISVGMGRSWLTIDRSDVSDEVATGVSQLNFGAGARWTFADHLAFSIDLRWHSIGEAPATIDAWGHPPRTMVIFSSGISFM